MFTPSTGRCARRDEPREAAGRGIRPAVVEAHAVHERAVGDEPEQARPRVAGLGDRRDRADLDVPEPEVAEAAHRVAVLVEPGGDAEGRREAQAERLDGERRVGRGEALDEPCRTRASAGRG